MKTVKFGESELRIDEFNFNGVRLALCTKVDGDRIVSRRVYDRGKLIARLERVGRSYTIFTPRGSLRVFGGKSFASPEDAVRALADWCN